MSKRILLDRLESSLQTKETSSGKTCSKTAVTRSSVNGDLHIYSWEVIRLALVRINIEKKLSKPHKDPFNKRNKKALYAENVLKIPNNSKVKLIDH